MKIRERSSVELDRFQLFCDACQAINNLLTIILALSHAFKSVNYSGNKFPGF